MNNIIDVRSDTVTRPSEHMRQVMMQAPVGDDVYGDDPSVNELQAFTADLLGHQSALFMPSGTQSNLVALLTHCQRGDEYIVGADAHTYKYEGGGAAALGGIQPQTLAFNDDGGLDLDTVATLIKEDDVHFAKTRLLCLENSQHGRVQSLESMQQAQHFAAHHGLKLHLDGARMANAAVALGVTMKQMGQCFDSVSICLSKGLGAPVGSVLVGDKDFIDRARRWRKVTGGGLRQAGMLAAAGKLALTDGFNRLHEDHTAAQQLAREFEAIDGVSVRQGWTQTNMVWLEFDYAVDKELALYAHQHNVRLSVRGKVCRLVMHHDVSLKDVATLVDVIRQFLDSDAYARCAT